MQTNKKAKKRQKDEFSFVCFFPFSSVNSAWIARAKQEGTVIYDTVGLYCVLSILTLQGSFCERRRATSTSTIREKPLLIGRLHLLAAVFVCCCFLSWPFFLQEMDLYRYSAAFPELVIPVLGHLRKFAKTTKANRNHTVVVVCVFYCF